MTRQLTFDLPVRAALGREDFFVSPANALAVAALDRPEGWPLAKLVLVGPDGSGKSHLAAIWAETHGARVVAAEALDPQALMAGGPVVAEDIGRVAGDPRAERALLHLHNLMVSARRPFLMTSDRAPATLGVTLPDLASRLQATTTATLAPPDDALLSAVLVKLFADRQIAVSPQLVRWLVARMDRSFAAARWLVGALDARALAERRPVGRALAAEVLDTWKGAAP